MAEVYDQQQDVSRLLSWFDANRRDLPWRQSKNPYAIWVSEIMLQQTRVDQATPYYLRFMQQFPTVHDLANAEQQQLMKAWEGLGYYSRARNLQAAAKEIVDSYNGLLPTNYDALISLKGIGPYTAAAIASIAFGEAKAAIDGNVIRVVSRYFGIQEDVTKTAIKKHIGDLAQSMIDKNRPGDFNEAMMELGATICKVGTPLCDACPLQRNCVADKMVMQTRIPYKPKKKKVPTKDIAVGIMFNEQQKVLIAKRPEEGLLGGLWEFPGGKKEENESLVACLHREFEEELAVQLYDLEAFMEVKHAYSHFKVVLHVYLCKHKSGVPKPLASQEIKWVSLDELSEFAFPKANHHIIEALNKRFAAS